MDLEKIHKNIHKQNIDHMGAYILSWVESMFIFLF